MHCEVWYIVQILKSHTFNKYFYSSIPTIKKFSFGPYYFHMELTNNKFCIIEKKKKKMYTWKTSPQPCVEAGTNNHPYFAQVEQIFPKVGFRIFNLASLCPDR